MEVQAALVRGQLVAQLLVDEIIVILLIFYIYLLIAFMAVHRLVDVLAFEMALS